MRVFSYLHNSDDDIIAAAYESDTNVYECEASDTETITVSDDYHTEGSHYSYFLPVETPSFIYDATESIEWYVAA